VGLLRDHRPKACGVLEHNKGEAVEAAGVRVRLQVDVVNLAILA
jgi:hypothetical protein